MNLYQPTITGSLSVSGSVNISGSITIEGGGTISGTASIATTALTASFVANAQTASYVLNAVSSSFALTASSADNLLVRNTLTAQTLVVQTITSSVDFVTGSTRFGSSLSTSTHQFTGSVSMNPGGLFVSSSGLVGIGNIVPAYTLDVSGTGRFTGALTGTSATFSSSVTATQGKFSGSRPQGIFTENGTSGLYLRDATGTGYKSWSIGTNDIVVGFAITPSTALGGTTFTTPSFVINESGNVGIGTSSPLSLLHIASADTDQGIRLTRANGTFGIRITRTGQIQGKLVDDVTFQTAISLTEGNTSGNQYLALQPTAGNVLIGTTTDNGDKLQVNGACSFLTNISAGQGSEGGVRLVVKGATAASDSYSIIARNVSSTDLFVVRNDGVIFTGTAARSPVNDLNGAAANLIVVAGGNLQKSTASSGRYKENITDWSGNGLETILALKPKTFTYKESYYKYSEVVMLGLIAEEVAEVSEYLADYENQDRTGQVENVRYATIVVPLIKAVQELKAEFDEYKTIHP